MAQGLELYDANGKVTLSTGDRITRILWEGVIPYPRDSPTSPRWPSSARPGGEWLTSASSRIEITSEGFKEGVPFVMFKDHNGKYLNDNLSKKMCGIAQVVSWSMTSETKMSIIYAVFSPGWSQNDVLTRYNALDVPIMVGVY